MLVLSVIPFSFVPKLLSFTVTLSLLSVVVLLVVTLVPPAEVLLTVLVLSLPSAEVFSAACVVPFTALVLKSLVTVFPSASVPLKWLSTASVWPIVPPATVTLLPSTYNSSVSILPVVTLLPWIVVSSWLPVP